MIQLLALIIVLIGIYWAVSSVFGFFAGIAGLVFTVLVWMLIGWLAGKALRGKGYGPVGDAALGLGGGIVGSIVLGILGLNVGGLVGTIIGGVVGAVILIFLIRLLHDADFAR